MLLKIDVLKNFLKSFLGKHQCQSTFLTNFFISLFLSFSRNQKQESNFQQVVGLLTKVFSVFCLQRVVLYFKDMPNSIYFCIGILLRFIPVRIIVTFSHIFECKQPFSPQSIIKKKNCAVQHNYYELLKHETHVVSVRSHSGYVCSINLCNENDQKTFWMHLCN